MTPSLCADDNGRSSRSLSTAGSEAPLHKVLARGSAPTPAARGCYPRVFEMRELRFREMKQPPCGEARKQ